MPCYNAEYMRKRHKRRMDAAKEHLGGICQECGSSENLRFIHIDPSTKLFAIGSGATKASEKNFWIEVDKCELLCQYCWRQRYWKTGEAAHGTITRFQSHKCRCAECRKAFNDYQAAWKRERRRKAREQGQVYNKRRRDAMVA